MTERQMDSRSMTIMHCKCEIWLKFVKTTGELQRVESLLCSQTIRRTQQLVKIELAKYQLKLSILTRINMYELLPISFSVPKRATATDEMTDNV